MLKYTFNGQQCVAPRCPHRPPRQKRDVSLQLRAGEVSRGGHLHLLAPQWRHTMGTSHQIIFFRIGRTHGWVYITVLGERPTSSGKNLHRPLQSCAVQSGTWRGGPEGGRVLCPELGHGGLGFCGFCHHQIIHSSPQQMQRKTAPGKCLRP